LAGLRASKLQLFVLLLQLFKEGVDIDNRLLKSYSIRFQRNRIREQSPDTQSDLMKD
jgi:hypothetical protein